MPGETKEMSSTPIRKSAVDILKSGRLLAFASAFLIFFAALIGEAKAAIPFSPFFFQFLATRDSLPRWVADALLFFGVTAGKPPDPLFFEFEFRHRYLSLEPTYLAEQWVWNLKVIVECLRAGL